MAMSAHWYTTASEASPDCSADFSGDAMTYGIIDCLMISLICGFTFGAVYEILRIIRRIFSFVVITFICDVCFFVLAALFVLRLSLFLGNYVRIYTLFGFGAGIFAYIHTVGRIAGSIEMIIIQLWQKSIGRLLGYISNYLSSAIGAFAHNTGKQFGKIHDFFADKMKKGSTLLHFHPRSMYNSTREKITIGESSRGKNVIKAKITRSS